MKFGDWLMLAAVFLGPIVSIQVSEFLQRRRDARARKEWIFKTLMATRGALLAPRHVEALNVITLEFSEKSPKEREVLSAWRSYLDFLNGFGDISQLPPIEVARLEDKRNDLLTHLLQKMATALEYHFDEVQIRRGCYAPRGHDRIENEQSLLRGYLLDLLEGKRGLPVYVPGPQETTKSPKAA